MSEFVVFSAFSVVSGVVVSDVSGVLVVGVGFAELAKTGPDRDMTANTAAITDRAMLLIHLPITLLL